MKKKKRKKRPLPKNAKCKLYFLKSPEKICGERKGKERKGKGIPTTMKGKSQSKKRVFVVQDF